MTDGPFGYPVVKLRGRSDAPLRVVVAADAVFSHRASSVLDSDGRFSISAETTQAAEAGRCAIQTRPDVILISVDLDGGGIAATREILARLPRSTVVMIADDGGGLFPALRAGAEGYLLRD